MTHINRRLWFASPEGNREILEQELLGRAESLVILGEPGMGKTQLLRKLAVNAGTTCISARRLINNANPQSLLDADRPIIIDALDEVPAQGVGDAVDKVLRQLSILGFPRFILSCRVAEWRSATSISAISEEYEEKPLELNLIPFSEVEQQDFLSQKLGPERAAELLNHFRSFGLDFLGNPLTIDLVARLPADDELPTSSGALFELAVEALRKEHREGATELPGTETREAAGAAFAGLIVSGKSKITHKASANLEDDEVAFIELDALSDASLDQASKTKLFASAGKDSLTYLHPRIGEFLGAAWLSRSANTNQKRLRLLSLFHSEGRVPSSLRGLHAWLARDGKLAKAVITADPMGVIEYGDADELSPEHASVLFDALVRLSEENPWFKGWHDVRAKALLSPPLSERAEALLNDKSATFHLRAVIADQLGNEALANRFRESILSILLDEDEIFYLRRQAAEGAALLEGIDWDAKLEELLSRGSEDSSRLAYELIELVGFETFTDDQIVRIILAYDGLLNCRIPREHRRSSLKSFWGLQDRIPQERVGGLLDTLAAYSLGLLPENAGIDENQFIDLAYSLILKFLEAETPNPERLLKWLRPYRNQYHYRRDSNAALAKWFSENDKTRRAIQKIELIDCEPEQVWPTAQRLFRVSAGLIVNDEDVAVLLSYLDPDDRTSNLWREFLSLVRHDGEDGRAARDAALPFVAHNKEMQAWLQRLPEPKRPIWEEKEARRRKQRERKQAALWETHRRDYKENIEKVREGQFGFIHGPAQAYLKMFRDIGDELAPHERIAQWLGEEIATAAHTGFENFISRKESRIGAKRIAASYAQGTRWLATDVLIAALAERVRTRSDKPFEGLSDDRLLAGLFTLWHSRIDDHAKIPDLLELVEFEVEKRGLTERAIRLYITPQLKKRQKNIDGLYRLMRAKDKQSLATKLAIEWLFACPSMPAEPEAEMIDRIIASKHWRALRNLFAIRNRSSLDVEQRRNWDAVQVIADFDEALKRLEGNVEKELLWHLRERSADHGSDNPQSPTLLPVQRAWIVSTFRGFWPDVSRPTGTSSGNTNAWNASEFLKSQISLLGDDPSQLARKLLSELCEGEQDSYSEYLRVVRSEQSQKAAEEAFSSPSIEDLVSVLEAGEPISPDDLRAIMLDNLDTAQEWVKGHPHDWYKGFFKENGEHKSEDDCRDELIKMLSAIDGTLDYDPEGHLADDKRADIVVRSGHGHILPIEIKGQWHQKIWTAADDQLDLLYGNDWRAKNSIFLVFWFGADVKLRQPPNQAPRPNSPEELQEALVLASKAAREGRTSIFVLDLTRPAAC